VPSRARDFVQQQLRWRAGRPQLKCDPLGGRGQGRVHRQAPFFTRMGSMLRRVSFQTGPLRSTYERFLTMRGMDRPARQMLALLPGLDAMCEGVPIWGMTAHEWLLLFSVPDREGGRLLVRIVPVPSGGYAVGYPVADATGATRESLRIVREHARGGTRFDCGCTAPHSGCRRHACLDLCRLTSA